MIRFSPHYVKVPWGGHRFASEFTRDLGSDAVGESWELGELDQHHSVVKEGPHAGKSLGELWRAGVLGGSASGRFPFLLKWIDTAEKLSVQVHPDQKVCDLLGEGQPKSEAWYFAQTEPRSMLWLGHYPGLDPMTLALAAKGGTVQKWMYETRPRVGDFVYLPAGTLHCIGEGYLILEVQQPSDTTYRIYDWGRVGLDGKPRPLHIEQAQKAIDFKRHGAPKASREKVVGPCFSMRIQNMGSSVEPSGLRVFVADSGPAKLRTQRGDEVLEYGDVVVAEPADGTVYVATGTCILVSEPEKVAK